MLKPAFGLLCLTVLLGAWLVLFRLRPEARRPPWPGRAAHGVFGAGGLALLLLSWPTFGGPQAWFAHSGAVLVAAALPLGLAYWLGWDRLGRARDGMLILHAFAAIAGLVLLSGWFLNN
jgi:hypothetical protein